MESFESVKSEPSARRHPEDTVDSDDESDIESTSSKLDEKTTTDDHQNIPGTGPNDMGYFKTSSNFSGSFQTGVKGVLADATSYESARRRTLSKNRNHYDAQYVPEVPASTPLTRERSSDAESGEDDEDFVRTWRKNRLAELKTGVATTRRQSPSKRTYGRVESVDAAGYLDAIDKVSSETVVLVLIYNDETEESKFVEDCLNTLCRRYTTTRFVKLHHTEAEMESKVVPAVLAYKGGELFANIMRIVDEIPSSRSLSTESLELVLRRANVLHKD